MNDINELFFSLIRVAIGTQDTLSRQPSAREWKQLYKMAKKQSLVGICFAGVQKISLSSPLKDEEEVETKTLKTPSSISGSLNPTLDESSVPSENKLSPATANSSNGISPDAAIANGDKQEINSFGASPQLIPDLPQQAGPSPEEGGSFKSHHLGGDIEGAHDNNVFCGNATGLLPDAVVNPNMGCDVDGGLTMGARSQSQTDIHSTQSDSENNSRRGFSEGAVFVNNTDQDFSGFCQNINEEASIPELLYLRWMGMAAKIQQKNERVNRQCVEVQQMLAADGFRSCILKGQGNAALYKCGGSMQQSCGSSSNQTKTIKTPSSISGSLNPTLDESSVPSENKLSPATANSSNGISPDAAIANGDKQKINHLHNEREVSSLSLLRQSGDIDVWVDGEKEKIVEWARAHGGEKVTGDLHVDCKVFPDTAVELHFTPSVASSPKINRRLQEWFEQQKAKLNGLETKTIKTSTNVCEAKASSANASESPCESKLSQIDSATSSLPTPGGSQPLVDDKQEINNLGVSRSPLKDEEVETKTIKTPSSTAGSANPTLDESSVPSENKLSPTTANSSNGISSDAAIANGDKQEINNSFESTDSTDVSQVGPIKACNDVAETNKNVFCGKATGLLPEAVVNPNMGCDVDGSLTMGAGSQSQTDIHSTQSDSENNSRRGFSEGAVFVNNTDQDFSGFCQNINEGAYLEFNVVYLLHHIFRHYLYEGVGLRQVMDYYMALCAVQEVRCSKAAVQEALTVIKELGMEKFAGAVMYVMREVFGMEEKYMICPVDEKRGRRLLEVIMEGGNFGRSGEYAITGGEHSAWWHIKRYVGRNSKLLRYYPSEIIWHLIMKLKI